jgi:hypothetical protein
MKSHPWTAAVHGLRETICNMNIFGRHLSFRGMLEWARRNPLSGEDHRFCMLMPETASARKVPSVSAIQPQGEQKRRKIARSQKLRADIPLTTNSFPFIQHPAT